MKMLTPKFLLYLKKVFNLGGRFYWHPFIWNEVKNGPELTESKKTFLFWITNATLVFAYYVFLLWKSILVTTSCESSMTTKLFMQFALLLFSLPVFIQLNIMFSLREFPQFIQAYLQYCANFEGKFVTIAKDRWFSEKLKGISVGYPQKSIYCAMQLLHVSQNFASC